MITNMNWCVMRGRRHLTRLRIIDTAYNSKSNHGEVEIYGITDKGEKIVAVDSNFYPYIYVSYCSDILGQLLEDKDILYYEVTALVHEQQLIEVIKVFFRYPWLVRDFRKKFAHLQFFGADINFGLRYMYDLDLGNTVEIEGNDISSESYVADRAIRIKSIKNCDPFDVPLKIMSFDIEQSRSGRMLCLCAMLMSETGEILDEFTVTKGGDSGIVEGFVEIFKRWKPDVLTGYFINGYDLPLLEEKSIENKMYQETKGKLPLSSNFSPLHIKDRNTRSVGLIVADAHYWARRIIKPKKETLNYVSWLLLGEEKLDVNRSDIDGEWAKNRERVVKYCMKDAWLAAKVLIKTKALKQGKDSAVVNMLPLSDIMADHQSFRVDSFAIRIADREGIAVPMNNYGGEEEEKIEGAYVRDIPKGVFDLVIGLDFKGMYPSMIINNNICFTTFDMENGTIESPVGAKFVSSDVRVGIIPRVMIKLRDERDKFKTLMRAAKQNNDKENEEYYDGLQDSLKITMNSFYGVLTAGFYRFTNKLIGGSITGFARENIKSVIKGLETDGYNVLYSDTDSIFFQSMCQSIDEAEELGHRVSKKYSRGEAELEFEKVMDPLFSIGKKKRYYGKIVWPFKGFIVRGFQNRRGDSFDYMSKSMDDTFAFIGDKEYEQAIEFIKIQVKTMSLQEVPMEQLVISKSFKNEEQYVRPESMPQVQAAKKLRSRGVIVPDNTKVDYIVTDAKHTPQIVEPFHPSIENTMEPDWNYYFERFVSTFADIADALGISELELRQNQKQMSILSF